jgi:hypothetical protein
MNATVAVSVTKFIQRSAGKVFFLNSAFKICEQEKFIFRHNDYDKVLKSRNRNVEKKMRMRCCNMHDHSCIS